MRKRFYRPERAAKPDQMVEVRKVEFLPEEHPKAKQLSNVSYKGKPNPTIYKRTETDLLGQGKYIGEGKTITAFVWIDNDE